MNDALRVALKQAAPVRPAGEPGSAAAGGGRQQPEPRRVPGTDPAGRTGGAVRPPVAAPRQGGPVPRAEDAGRVRLVVQPVDQEEADLRPGDVPVRPRDAATCSCSDRRAWAKASWCRPSATRRSRRATRCCTARSSTWSATSCTTRRCRPRTRSWPRYLKPDLLIIDDMGMKQLPKRSGEYLFEIIMRRYETRSTMMTSNRPLEDWGKLIGDVPSATAILDRFLHHAELVSITGRSYRLRDRPGMSPDSPAESKPAKAPPARRRVVRTQNQPRRPPAPRPRGNRSDEAIRTRIKSQETTPSRGSRETMSGGKRKPVDA